MNILVCGAGALGSHFMYLGKDLGNGVSISVVDDDRVETKNLGSQWFVKQMIGKNKATAIKMQWQNFYGRKVKDFPVRLVEENVTTLFYGQDLVIDCFDNAESRHLLQRSVREMRIPCVHGGLAADGLFGVVRWDKDFVVDEESVPGQATCEGDGFLPIILSVSVGLVSSVKAFITESETQNNWNVTPTGAESFS